MPRRSTSLALAVGLGGVALVLAALWPFNEQVDLSVPALALLIPITAASVLGGWRVATPVAVVAAIGYAFGYVPPVGDVRPHVARDAVTLVTFISVGLIVGVLAHRGRDADERLLDARRAMLLHGVSHDLRNPLHTIQTVTSGLLGSQVAGEAARTSLQTVARESERLDRIVGNMLSASRIEAGALMPSMEPEHLPALVQATLNHLGGEVVGRVKVELPPGLPDVAVDAVQFDQVLTNLLENASRYVSIDGTVVVSARRSGRFAEVSVSDDGPGFSAEELAPRPFRRGASSSGIGLGLAVCRGIVEAHGGRLMLAHRPGGGAEVTFTVPLAG